MNPIRAMMKADKTRLLIIILLVIVVVGIALIMSRPVFNYSALVFDLLTYVVSIVALALAILSVLNSMRQNRILKKMVRDVHGSIAELQEVAQSTDAIEREIREEYHMNKVITDVLSEYGIGDTSRVRRSIARRVARRLKKTRYKA